MIGVSLSSERSGILPSALKSRLTEMRSKKTVRFADSMGFELVQYWFFASVSNEFVPVADQQLQSTHFSSCMLQIRKQLPKTTKCRLICKNFSFDVCHAAAIVHLQSLSLINMNITGVVCVANLAFLKQV